MKVNKNQCIIPATSLGVLLFRSLVDPRPVLSGVSISDGKIMCADGFKLAEAKVEQGTEFPNCLLNAKQILAAGLNENRVVIITKEDGFMAHGEYSLIVDPVKGKFPVVKELYDSTSKIESLASIGLQLAELEGIIAGLKKSGYNSITMRFRGNDKPIEFCVGVDESFKGLLMPYYTDAKNMPWVTGASQC